MVFLDATQRPFFSRHPAFHGLVVVQNPLEKFLWPGPGQVHGIDVGEAAEDLSGLALMEPPSVRPSGAIKLLLLTIPEE